MAAGEGLTDPGPPPRAHRGSPRGAPRADRRSPRGRLGPVGSDVRCDRCGDRSFARGRRSSGPCDRATASSRSSATASGSPTPSSRPPSIRRSRRLGVASCTRGSRRSFAIRRNEPATWPCPSRARTSPSPPPWRRPPYSPSPGERRNPRPSSGRWPAAPRRLTEARTLCVGPTRRAWLTTSVGTPRWRGASWSKRWTSRWPGRLGAASCWTWGWPSPRPKGGGGPGPCSRLLGARRATISRCGHGSSRTSGTPGCSGETSRHRNGTLTRRCSWPRSCRSHG